MSGFLLPPPAQLHPAFVPTPASIIITLLSFFALSAGFDQKSFNNFNLIFLIVYINFSDINKIILYSLFCNRIYQDQLYVLMSSNQIIFN